MGKRKYHQPLQYLTNKMPGQEKYTSMQEFLRDLESAIEEYEKRLQEERRVPISPEERGEKREALIKVRKKEGEEERMSGEKKMREKLEDLFKQNDNLNDLSGILHAYGKLIFSYSTTFDYALILSKDNHVPEKARRKYKNSVKDYVKARDLWFAAEAEKREGRFEEAKKLYIESLQKEEQASNSYFDAIGTELDKVNKRIKKLKGN